MRLDLCRELSGLRERRRPSPHLGNTSEVFSGPLSAVFCQPRQAPAIPFLVGVKINMKELSLCQILRLGVARSIVTVFDLVEKEMAHLRM